MPNQEPNLEKKFNSESEGNVAPPVSPPSSYPYSETFPDPAPRQSNLIKIIVGVVLIIVLGVGTTLAARIWDPLWNPFRSNPEKVIGKMAEKMKEVKTIHSDINGELIVSNDLEFNIKGKVWTDADNSDPKNLKSVGGMDINLSVEGVQFSLGMETRQIGETSYFKLTTIPALPFIESYSSMMGIDLKELKNKWIKSDKESLKKLWGEEYLKEQEEEEKKQEAMIEEFKKIIGNKKLYLIKEELPDEKINGKKAYHYTVALNNEEIKKIIPELFEVAGEALRESFDLSGARLKTKEARIAADMGMIRMAAELFYYDNYSYKGFSCDQSDASEPCEDIAEHTGAKLIIFDSQEEYCAFTVLPVKDYYSCVDSTLKIVTTNVSPQGTGYCNGKTFVCPANVEISEEDYKKATTEEFSKDLDKFFEKAGELSGELWVGKKDYYPYRFKGEKTFDLSQFEEGEKGTVSIKLNIDLFKFNEPMKIEEPEEYKNLEEILGGMFDRYGEYLGESQTSARDARIVADMSQIRLIAELLYDSDNNSYKNLCSNQSNLNKNAPFYGIDLADLENDIYKQGGGFPVCYSSVGSYCVNVSLISSGKGEWCIDSSLASKEIAYGQSCLGSGTANNPYRCPSTSGIFPLNEKANSLQASLLESILKIFRK